MKEYTKINDVNIIEILSSDYNTENLFLSADKIRKKYYSNKVYIRGLIEISNYCKNNCYYCGIRRDNLNICRYRLEKSEILDSCDIGYLLGFRTFVLQGGEDNHFSDEYICDIIYSIKSKYSDCAITLSIGEKSYESYKKYYDAGADRYLLRHETANAIHYNKLHPDSMSLDERKKCLFNLKDIGYQVGSGFMVGSPFQTVENIVEDLRFLEELMPDMIGIGPFISHHDTPFKEFKNGSLELTLKLIAILRHMFPYSLIPATTALATLGTDGRQQALKVGANVIMPNLSPTEYRNFYSLYDNKKSFGSESAEQLNLLKEIVNSVGYEIVQDIGNVILH